VDELMSLEPSLDHDAAEARILANAEWNRKNREVATPGFGDLGASKGM
jgi:hypothetical protein